MSSPRRYSCLIVQTGGLGSVFQSLLSAKAAAQLYPQVDFDFVVRADYAGIVERVSWVRKVHALPIQALVSDASLAKARLAQWLGQLVNHGRDFVVNWSFSPSSSYLCSLIPSLHRLGYHRDHNLEFRCADDWSQYVQGIVANQVPQDIHIADVCTTQLLTCFQINIGEPDSSRSNESVTSRDFFQMRGDTLSAIDNEILAPKHWVVLHLDGAVGKRVWQASEWKELASKILANHPRIHLVLLGGHDASQAANELLESFASATGRVISFVGNSDFDALTMVLRECRWVISEDSPLLHLASVLSTRCLVVGLEPGVFMEHAPYGNGHYVVARPGGLAPSVDAVYLAWSYAVADWSHQATRTLKKHIEIEGVAEVSIESIPERIYRSSIRMPDAGGGVKYEDLTQKKIMLSEWTAQFVGHLARSWYCGWTPDMGSELKRARISPELLGKLREVAQNADALEKVALEAIAQITLLIEKSKNLKSDQVMAVELRKDLETIGKKVRSLDELMARLAGIHDPIRALYELHRVLMHHAQGTRLNEVGKESQRAYKQVVSGVRVLKKWIETTLSLTKPVAIAPSSNQPHEEPII